MRIAIAIDFKRVLCTPQFKARRLSTLGEKTVFYYDFDEIEDAVGLNRLRSFVGNKVSGGLKAVLVCQPYTTGDQRLLKVKAGIGSWLDNLAGNGISCHHRDYDPASANASETVLELIDDFPVKYSKTLEEMMDSSRFLTTRETAAILSEHYGVTRERDVRRLDGLRHERRGKRSLGFRECDVATYIKNNT